MATETGPVGATASRPGDIGLRREMGLIGATWASETSIIGSGWLFAGMGAAVLAGPAAIYGWLIGGGRALGPGPLDARAWRTAAWPACRSGSSPGCRRLPSHQSSATR